MALFNFLRFRKRVPEKGPPPKNFVDVSFDAESGKMVARDSDDNPVLFDAAGGAVSTADLTTSDGSAAAAAGDLGEYVESKRPLTDLLALSNTTAANVCSVDLSAGDWEVGGVVTFDLIGATITGKIAKTTQVSANVSVDGTEVYDSRSESGATETTSLSTPTRRFLLTSPATIYLATICAFSGGTVRCAGFLHARRVR